MVIPSRGFSDISIFINSSRTRSAEIIEMREAIAVMAAVTSGSIAKLS